MVDIPKTSPVAEAPAGMVLVPQADFSFQVNGVEIEGNDQEGNLPLDLVLILFVIRH